ncbi:hypothetical protein ACA910_007350 [Epithemia clementina (nom. ined.)]
MASKYFERCLFVLTVLSIALPLGCWAAIDCIGPKVLAQKQSPLPSSNGCSKPSGLVVGGEEDFTYCCDRHDVCYSACGMSKDLCEKDFGKCMKNLCRTTFPNNPQCPQAAQMYQLGTTMFGVQGFGELQNEYCTCVDRSSIVDHYKTLFQSIYQTHSNKTSDEIESTIENLFNKVGATTAAVADSNNNQSANVVVKKLSALFYQILRKYDTAIRHEEKRIGMNPPKPKKTGDEL